MADRQHAALLLLLLAACAAQESGPRYTSVEPERWPVRVGVPSFGELPPPPPPLPAGPLLLPACIPWAKASNAACRRPAPQTSMLCGCCLRCRLTPLLVQRHGWLAGAGRHSQQRLSLDCAVERHAQWRQLVRWRLLALPAVLISQQLLMLLSAG